MAVNLSPVGGVAGQFFDNNGNPLSGGKIFTYAAGTTTNQATYTSASGGTAHANPIILDSAGRVPSGEIWLTDGLAYKFVVKDSNDVLIGTYDNIVGINSNFVNFTNEQEIQTATAGQTVFTLTTMQYAPATNSLSVFVDGVNQYGPGALYAYVETDSTTVTFTTGLHVGAEVKFTTSNLNSSAGGDASQVSYEPPFANAVITNVEAKLSEIVSVEDFGAIGDNITNDRAAFTAAFAASDCVRLTPGKTYFLGDVTSSAAIFQMTGANKVIDCSGAKIRVNTTGGNYNAGLFELDDIDGFSLVNPDIQDSGFDQSATFKGITVVRFNIVNGAAKNIHVTGAKYLNVVSSFDVISSADVIENIWFDGEVKDSVYGLNFSNNGHYLTADYRTDGCVRSYLVTGVKGHKINCISRNHLIGNADFLLNVTDPNKPLVDLNARFMSVDSQTTTNPQLMFQSINSAGTTVIKNVNIFYDDSLSPLATKSISFRHYLTQGGAIQATDPNQKGPIYITGNITQSINYDSEPTSPQLHNFDNALGLLPTFNAFKSAISSNVTGDGTVYDVVFDTELFDYGSAYNAGTGVFTAPRDGVYTFSARVLILGRTAAETRVDLRLATTPKTFFNTTTLSAGIPIPENSVDITVNRLFLKKNETAKVVLMSSGGTKVIDVYGDSGLIATYFSGGLVTGSPVQA